MDKITTTSVHAYTTGTQIGITSCLFGQMDNILYTKSAQENIRHQKKKKEKNNTKTESCSEVQQSQNKLYIRFKFGDNNFKMNRK